MKRSKILVVAVIVAGILWVLGTLLQKTAVESEKLHEKALAEWQNKVSLIEKTPKQEPKEYLEAKTLYRNCEKHLSGFLFFLRNDLKEQAGEERDSASADCNAAQMLMIKFAQSSSQGERFYALYALGNIDVRRAMLALSTEEQTNALAEAINSYIAALLLKDDYQTKFNLELLLSIDALAREAAGRDRRLLAPNEFKLAPMPGAALGTPGKSQL